MTASVVKQDPKHKKGAFFWTFHEFGSGIMYMNMLILSGKIPEIIS